MELTLPCIFLKSHPRKKKKKLHCQKLNSTYGCEYSKELLYPHANTQTQADVHTDRRNNCSIHNRCQQHKETETQRPIYRVRRCTKLLNLAYNCMNLAKCLQTDTHWLTNTHIDRQETGVGADTTSVSVSSQTHFLFFFFLTLSAHNSHQRVSLLVYLFMWSGLTGKSHKRLKNSGVHYRLQP